MAYQLIADIGGTNARFALASGGALIAKRVIPTAGIKDLSATAKDFLRECGEAARDVVFAVAAPVLGDDVALTNAALAFSISQTKAALGADRLQIVNDFAAMARGAAATKNLTTIKDGISAPGEPVVVLGPGTGLGVAILLQTDRVRVVPTQGGHAAFAPQNADEQEIWRALSKEHEFVSFEHVASGAGLAAIHRILHAQNLPPPQITAYALAGDKCAVRTFETFFYVLATFAADAALMTGARGGVVLAGGILPRVEPLLRQSRFNMRFVSRPRMTDYLQATPVRLLTDPDAALIGAALLGRGE